MGSKKQTKPRPLPKRNRKCVRTVDKKVSKPLPDTSRIPWFSALPKTGTDA